MFNRYGTGKVIIAAVSAGLMTLIVTWMMPFIQPVIVSTADVIDSILSSDADEVSIFVTDFLIPLLPIALPIITFFAVFLRVSKGGRVM